MLLAVSLKCHKANRDKSLNKPYDEQSLVTGLRRGDPEAQAALLELYGEPLIRFLIAVCHVNALEAEDLAVETLYRAIERIDSFREKPGASRNAFRNWLFTIARNLWRDQLRRHKRLIYLDDMKQAIAPPTRNEHDENSPAVQAVRDAIKALPDSQRQTLLLHYGGLQLKEVADVLNVTPGTARQWKRRGIAKLTRILKKHPAIVQLIDDQTAKIGETSQ